VYDWYAVYEVDTDAWEDYTEKIFDIIAEDFSDFYYYCSLAANDVKEVNEEKFDEFQGIDDIYTSFLFNLLEESLQIQDTATDLSEAESNGDWVTFVSNLAELINLILDFESATAASNPSAITDPQEAI